MSAENETIGDIRQESETKLRDELKKMFARPPDPLRVLRLFNDMFDRIEAAHEREVEDAERRGNHAAAMREALEHIAAIPMPPPNELAQSIAVEMREVALAALVSPPRQCDVGTAEEQAKRFTEFCYKNRNVRRCCGDCPAFNFAECELAWAQMPYEEGGAK